MNMNTLEEVLVKFETLHPKLPKVLRTQGIYGDKEEALKLVIVSAAKRLAKGDRPYFRLEAENGRVFMLFPEGTNGPFVSESPYAYKEAIND